MPSEPLQTLPQTDPSPDSGHSALEVSQDRLPGRHNRKVTASDLSNRALLSVSIRRKLLPICLGLDHASTDWHQLVSAKAMACFASISRGI